MSSAHTVLVTGASGFIGRHLCARLAREGACVRALVRPGNDASALDRLDRERARPLERAVGSLDDAASLERALVGVETVFHLAGLTRATRLADLARVNEHGTGRLLAAARRSGSVRRLVHVSSLAALGPTSPERPLDESAPPRPVSAYGRSKLAGEALARAEADRLTVSIVRPPIVYGPGDASTREFVAGVGRGRPIRPRGLDPVYSCIHVDDLVELLARVGSADRPAPLYHVAGADDVTLLRLQKVIADALGVRLRPLGLPRPAMRALALVADAIALWNRRPAAFGRARVAELFAAAWLCDDRRARRELGHAPAIRVADGMAQLLRDPQERPAA
jgi:nucleoside-diphosphate-sugar epimerase